MGGQHCSLLHSPPLKPCSPHPKFMPCFLGTHTPSGSCHDCCSTGKPRRTAEGFEVPPRPCPVFLAGVCTSLWHFYLLLEVPLLSEQRRQKMMLPSSCINGSLVGTMLFSQMDTLCSNLDQGLWDRNRFYCLRVILAVPPPYTHSKHAHASPPFPSPFCSSDIPVDPMAESLQGAADPTLPFACSD